MKFVIAVVFYNAERKKVTRERGMMPSYYKLKNTNIDLQMQKRKQMSLHFQFQSLNIFVKKKASLMIE